MKFPRTLAATALLAAMSLPAFAQDLPQPVISISATGSVVAEPDQAKIGFSVHSTDTVARDAMRKNTEMMTQAFALLQSAGIAPQDIATSSIALSPRYQNQVRNSDVPPRIIGYEARNAVTVTVRDIDNLGAVLDGLVESGVNAIGNVTFGISDPSELEAEARAKAARSARAKAEAYAEAIGTSVTGIVSMSEGHGVRPMAHDMRLMAMESASAVPVSGGAMDISASINVVFSLDGELD